MTAYLESQKESLLSLLNASEVTISAEDYRSEDGGSAPSVVCNAGAIFLPLSGLVDVAAEKAKLEKQQADLQKWIKSAEGKLSNANFVAKAPPQVIEASRKQLEELQQKLQRVEEALASLK